MPSRRAVNNSGGANPPDPALIAAVTQAVTAMLPNIINAVRNTGEGAGGNPPIGIHTWLEKFQKQKPRPFTKASTPAVARDWIAHIEKIFRVLGVEDQFKARLASYKLEEDAQTWWEGVLGERGGDQFVENLSWADFRSVFFEKYFNSVDKSHYTREYHNLRQRDNESLSEFTDRFYLLIGFLGPAAGIPEEQAEKYQWAVCDRIRRAIIHSTFATVAEAAKAAKAAKKVDMERQASLTNSDDSRKRIRDENRTSDSSQGSGKQTKPWQGRNQNQQPIQAQPINQRGNQNAAQFPLCDHCNKHHPGVCRRLTGACLKCGEMGHMIKDCPETRNRIKDTTRGA